MSKRKTFAGYKSYNFIDKDPVIDILRTLVQIEAAQRGLNFGAMLKVIQNNSGVRAPTMHNWFSGPTVSPRFCSAAAVARALGQLDLPLTRNRRANVKLVASR